MEIRLATLEDMEELKKMYTSIIQNMEDRNISIWDEVYPCVCFNDDIKEQQLYLLHHKNEIRSAFALCTSHAGADKVQWKKSSANSLYLDRFAVHVTYSHKGLGSFVIEKAKEIAKAKGYDAIRLFVVDYNIPAIQFYEKNGFIKADGIYDEVIDEDLIFHEYGYEITL